MEIKVFNEETIQKYKTDIPHIVISVQDPTCDFVSLPDQESRVGLLQMQFGDYSEDISQFPYSRYVFTSCQAKLILDFVKTWIDEIDLILVNCCAGISRSAGIAGALSKIYNGDDSYFFKRYLPNSLVYNKLLKEYYGQFEQEAN